MSSLIDFCLEGLQQAGRLAIAQEVADGLFMPVLEDKLLFMLRWRTRFDMALFERTIPRRHRGRFPVHSRGKATLDDTSLRYGNESPQTFHDNDLLQMKCTPVRHTSARVYVDLVQEERHPMWASVTYETEALRP